MKTMKKIISIGVGIMLLGGGLVGCTQGPTAEEIELGNKASFDLGVASVNVPVCAPEKVCTTVTCPDVPEPVVCPISEDIQEIQCEIDTETAASGYILEDLEIGAEFSVVLTDRNIALFDGEYEFDDEDYDADETIAITATVGANEEDYNGETYLQFNEEGIRYCLEFENDLDTSLIDEDETLEVNLLGKAIEITDWNSDSITVTSGEAITSLKEGETRVTDSGISITVHLINDGACKISLNGETNKVYEDETQDFNGDQVLVTSAMASDDSPDECDVEVGDDLSKEIEDGDEYVEDSVYSYAITESEICVELNTEFKYLDEDEAPLSLGGSIALPEDYANFIYSGLTIEDEQEIDINLYTKRGTEYIRAQGNFLAGKDDYTKIYIDSNGIYDDDLDKIADKEIQIEDTEVSLRYSGGKLIIGDIEIDADLESIEVAGEDISSFDETFVTAYGMKITNPDDSTEDQKFEITIPEEQLVAEVVVQ